MPILPGETTEMWTFGGRFPGPTLRLHSGRPARVRFTNHLPAGAGAVTIHNHGGHSPSPHDGQPATHLIPPGGRRTYTYPLVEGKKPERGAFQWYHDHRDAVTGRNVWNGLAGMVIVEDELERRLPLPKGRFDVPLMLTDRTFLDDNDLANPFARTTPGGPDLFPGAGDPPNDEIVGDHALVNGVPAPYFRVANRRYRFRVLNASNFQAYNLRLSNGGPMVQVATESGLLPRPVPRETVLLGPAERAEVVVDFTGQLGKRIVLESVPRENRAPAATDSASLRLVQFRVTERAGRDRSRIPKTLRPAPAFDTSGATRRTWTLALGGTTGDPAWTINGQTFDHHRVSAEPRLGSVEVWQYTNTSTVTHYMHNHDVDFRLLARNGAPPDPWEDGLKETFRVDPGETVQVAAKFTDHTGTFVLHCHMLEHEDHGMMTQFQVVAGNRSAAPRAVAEFKKDGREVSADRCLLHRLKAA